MSESLAGDTSLRAQPGTGRVIDTYPASGIIPCAHAAGEFNTQITWLRSSMVEQLTLNQLVEGSSPPGVTKIEVR